MDARGKFGEHEKCVRVARGAAESSSFSIALQISQVHPYIIRDVCYHSYGYKPKWTPLSPITITYYHKGNHEKINKNAF